MATPWAADATVALSETSKHFRYDAIGKHIHAIINCALAVGTKNTHYTHTETKEEAQLEGGNICTYKAEVNTELGMTFKGELFNKVRKQFY